MVCSNVATLPTTFGDVWLIVGFAVAVPGSLVSALYMRRRSGGSVNLFLRACWLTILVVAAIVDDVAHIPIVGTVGKPTGHGAFQRLVAPDALVGRSGRKKSRRSLASRAGSSRGRKWPPRLGPRH